MASGISRTARNEARAHPVHDLADKFITPPSPDGGGLTWQDVPSVSLAMKAHNLIAITAGGLAFLALLWLGRNAAPAPAAGNSTVAPQPLATKQTPVPVSPATIAAPVTAPATALSTPLASTPISATPTQADPQRELNTAIDDIVSLSQANDQMTLFNDYLSPADKAKMTPAEVDRIKYWADEAKTDSIAQQSLRNTAMMYQSLKGQTPEMNAAGDEATYHATPILMHPPDGNEPTTIPITFVKIDGRWYIQNSPAKD
jgi:hypothetical protein